MDTFQIIFLPDVSTLSIRNLHKIINKNNNINNGFAVTDKLSNEDIKEITDTAQLLSMDIKEFCYDENVPSLMESNQDTVIIGVSMVNDERNKVPRESTFDTSEKTYDESSESVIDALLKILDTDNNDSIETDFNTEDNIL